MTSHIRLVRTLVGAHVRKYFRTGVFISVASMLVTLELLLIDRLLSARASLKGTVSGVELWRISNAVLQNQLLLTVIAVVTVGVTMYLSYRGLADVIDARRSELAVFRRLGAPRRYVSRIILWELVLIAVLFSVVGAALGQALHFLMWPWFRAVGLLGGIEGMMPGISPLVVLGVVAVFAASSAVAAILFTRRAEDPLIPDVWHREAVRSSSTRRILWASLWLVVVVAAFIFAPVTGEHAGAWVLVSPLAAIVPFAIAAPVILLAVAKLLVRFLGKASPGPMFLAQAVITKDRHAIARKLVPVLIVVGLYGGFTLGVQPEQARAAAEYDRAILANVVVSKLDQSEVGKIRSAIGDNCIVVRQAKSSAFQDLERTGAVPPIILNFIDTADRAQVLSFSDSAGKVELLDDKEVISTRPGDRIGDEIVLTTLGGAQRTLVVVGTAKFGQIETLYSDWNSLAEDDKELESVEALLDCSSPDSAVALLRAQNLGGLVQAKKDYVAELSLMRVKNSERSNLMLFGTIYAITIVGMAQGAYSYGRQRLGEFQVVRSLGVSRNACRLSVLLEICVLLLTALLLVTCALALVLVRLWIGFRVHALESYVSLPVLPVLQVFLIVVVLLALGYLTGSWIAIERSKVVGRVEARE